MIKFFRHIRKQLMAEKKTRQYLLYAIGEILLVVVGILIALAISNNNDLKKIRQEEQRYLLALKEEFGFNKQELSRVMKVNSINMENALELIDHTGPGIPTITEQKFNSILALTVNRDVQFNPSPGVLNEIINSGKLGSFSDDKLKNTLASWEASLRPVRFQENEEVHRSRLDIINLMYDNISGRRFATDIGENNGLFSPSKFKGENQKLLQNEKFESLLVEFYFTSRNLNQHSYDRLENKIDEILALIEENINQ